ncbi:MAG: glycosyltransferase family 2 protein, partial [Chloroflexota bacterium]
MSPLVSVIIPTYNRSNLIRYAIQSVLWQTLANFELLVVGDGCTDDTAEVVASFSDARIHWHNLPENTGNQSAANNHALEHAQGKYIAYLGHDDLWYFTHLERLVSALETEQAALVHSLYEQIGWN